MTINPRGSSQESSRATSYSVVKLASLGINVVDDDTTTTILLLLYSH